MADLTVSSLSVEYRTATRIIRAVRDISFSVRSGERLALVGESGSGKTTTALALMQLIDPPGLVSGTARLGSIDLLALRGDRVRDARLKTVAYIPQGAMNSLNPILTVGRQLLDGLLDHGHILSRGERQDRVADALESVGLPAAVGMKYPHELSGGMRQRVCIAIGIMMGPQLIIADEPTSALDVITQKRVMATLVKAQEKVGCGLILIGHDMGLMAQTTHRVVVMRDGRIVEDAAVGDIFRSPAHPYSRQLIDAVPRLGGLVAAPPGPSDDAADTAVALLEFRGVTKSFRGGAARRERMVALEPCTFSFRSDRPLIISVVGQSGSGKTTMARIMLGLDAPTQGEVRFEGVPLPRLRGEALRHYRQGVQAIFQDPYSSFNPFYKVDRALAAPLVRFGLASGREEIYEAMARACGLVGLEASEVLGRFPHELSGGQRQRLMVARALMLRPRLLVADEPVSMVDASLRMTILDSLRELRDRHGISIFYITHDLATAYRASDFVMVLHRGRIVEAGAPVEVIESPMHGYTRSLVSAIPWPDPERRWGLATDDECGWDAPAAAVRGESNGLRLSL